MSKMAQHDLQCPSCGHTTPTTVWESINVTVDPRLKEQLFAGRVNMFECARCDNRTFVNASLLYHDVTLRYCTYFFPRHALDADDFYQKFNVDGSLAMHGAEAVLASMAGYLTQPHIVFDMHEMLRYVVFRDRLASSRTSSDEQGRPL